MASKAHKLYVWLFQVKVTGVCRLPVDMFRYDRAVPATEADAGKLEAILEDRATVEDRVVNLRMYDHSGRGPNVDRWRSFGCEVHQVRAAMEHEL